MTRNARTVSQSVTLRELGRLFEKDDFNAYPVEEDARIVGCQRFVLACQSYPTSEAVTVAITARP